MIPKSWAKWCESVGNVKSNTSPIEFGTPQGSTLVPILFLLYMNDILNLPLNNKIIFFADDAAIIYCATDIDTLNRMINEDSIASSNWFMANKLTLNKKNRNVWYFTHNREQKNLHWTLIVLACQFNKSWHLNTLALCFKRIHIGTYKLIISAKKKKTAQYRVWWIDSTTRLIERHWYQFTMPMSTATWRTLCLFGGTRRLVRSLTLYKLLKITLYDHSFMVSAPMNRVVTRTPFAGTLCPRLLQKHSSDGQDVRAEFEILSVRQNIRYCTAMLAFKIKAGLINNDIQIDTVGDRHPYSTQNANNIYQISFRTNAGRYITSRIVAAEFKSLPADLKNARSVYIFKKIPNHSYWVITENCYSWNKLIQTVTEIVHLYS